MYCALTVRKLQAGSFEQFREGFMPDSDSPPEGWVRFDMLRGVEDPDEVITFGFFDGSLEELQRSQDDDYQERLDKVAPFIESVGTSGLFEIVQEFARA